MRASCWGCRYGSGAMSYLLTMVHIWKGKREARSLEHDHVMVRNAGRTEIWYFDPEMSYTNVRQAHATYG